MDELKSLADLIKQRNLIDDEIAAIIDRPAERGHIGEFVAAAIFDIELHESASNKGSDGVFRSGPHKGRSVNVKFYGKDWGILEISPDDPPDFYLVLTGTKATAASSKGQTSPLTISSAFLFDHHQLVSRLTVKIGTATSVRRQFWDEAEIYPNQNDELLQLTPEQLSMLDMFGD